jgi:hypothetical protein
MKSSFRESEFKHIMRSTVQALTWEFLWLGRWFLIFFGLIAFLPMLVYASLMPLGVTNNDPAKLLLEVSLLPFIIFVMGLGVVVAQRPIARLYSRPLSNLSIASWQVGSCAAILALQTAIVTWSYNSLFAVGWPVVGPVVFAVVMSAVAQPFFCLASRSISQASISGLPLLLMAAWLMSHWGLFQKRSPRKWSELHAMEIVLLIGVFVLFWVLTTRSVSIDRCGESSKRTRLWLWLVQVRDRLFTLPSNDRRFRSMNHAQFWYEWKLKGLTLPFATACLAAYATICITVQHWGSAQNIVVELHQGMFVAAALIALLGGVCGLWFGCSVDFLTNASGRRRELDRKSDVDAISSFLAVRPLTDTAIARTILMVCAASLVLTVSLWLTAYGLIQCAAWVQQISEADLWNNEKNSWQGLVGLLCTAWITTSNAATITLTGRTKQLAFWFVGLFTAYIIAMIALEWQFGNYAVDILFKFVFSIVSVTLVVFAIWAFVVAVHQRLILKRDAILASMICLAAAGLCFAFLPFELNAGRAMLVVDCTILGVLAWATAPLAVAWNRHR